MQVFAPDYYYTFRCLAAACPDSCCKEWAVDVDDDAAEFYRALPGPLGDRLRQVLETTDEGAVMTIIDGRCPMWQQNGLCRIQAELGHEALCQTCRDFPRLQHDYGDFVELGLELSCPEAARLIFASHTRSVAERSVSGGDVAEYDADAMAVLRHSREAILDFLERKQYPLGQSLAILLLYGHAVQAQLDGGEAAVFDPVDCLNRANRYAQPGSMASVYDFFSRLEILTPRWKSRLDARPVSTTWDDSLRALARYGIERYWLQTVSDFDLICRVKFIIIACLLVNALGGDPVETAQLFSKEIENDPDNMDAVLDAAYTNQAFTDVRLLGLLLNPQKN